MPAFPRSELEEMVERWLQVNREAEAKGDWTDMIAMYTPDATYGWNYGPNEDFMTVGRDEIRDVALGLEMGGLDGWEYPYQKVLIDDQQGEVLGFWKRVPMAARTRSPGSVGAGSATPATSSGAGSATSSTSATRRPSSSRCSATTHCRTA